MERAKIGLGGSRGTGALQERVYRAAEQCLERDGAVGPLELLQQMLFLHQVHFQAWQKGNPYYVALEPHIQCGPAKLEKTYQYFHEWVRKHGLAPVEAHYQRLTPNGPVVLPVTADGDVERERFFRTRYAPAELTEKKAKKLRDRLDKAPELVVYELTSAASQCSECHAEILKGSLLFLEQKQPLCLACAELDHLVFLSSGDATLTRRARKYSSLSAVVVRFSRSRKRYERQGILITPDALAQAERDSGADGP
ncbi:MAG TPA: hypothetical protein VJ783_24150 [Pirellulales bacterium]|nr:hypothetical protein [Pirellulales bacterium]